MSPENQNMSFKLVCHRVTGRINFHQFLSVSTSFRNLLFLCVSVAGFLLAADISAPKMEILDTPEGRMTVFPLGITILDKDTKITGKHAIFYEKENRAKIYDSLLIISPQFTVTAETAFYSFAEKKSNLRGNVVLESDTLKILTTNLVFEQSKNIVKASEGVVIREKLQRLTITGRNAEYNFTDASGIVDSLPTLQIERADTTVVKSNKMLLDNKESRFWAIDSVSAEAGNTILRCDTLLYFIKEDSGLAMGRPQIVDKQNRIAGKDIRFYFSQEDSSNQSSDRSSLKIVRIIESANANYVTDEGGLLEVQGNIFMIYYLNGDIDNIKVFGDTLGNVSGKYYPKEKL